MQEMIISDKSLRRQKRRGNLEEDNSSVARAGY